MVEIVPIGAKMTHAPCTPMQTRLKSAKILGFFGTQATTTLWRCKGTFFTPLFGPAQDTRGYVAELSHKWVDNFSFILYNISTKERGETT